MNDFFKFFNPFFRLERRRNELDGESEKINELVNYLDVKKFEAIETSFNEISKNFALVFSKVKLFYLFLLLMRISAGASRKRAFRNERRQPKRPDEILKSRASFR